MKKSVLSVIVVMIIMMAYTMGCDTNKNEKVIPESVSSFQPTVDFLINGIARENPYKEEIIQEIRRHSINTEGVIINKTSYKTEVTINDGRKVKVKTYYTYDKPGFDTCYYKIFDLFSITYKPVSFKETDDSIIANENKHKPIDTLKSKIEKYIQEKKYSEKYGLPIKIYDESIVSYFVRSDSIIPNTNDLFEDTLRKNNGRPIKIAMHYTKTYKCIVKFDASGKIIDQETFYQKEFVPGMYNSLKEDKPNTSNEVFWLKIDNDYRYGNREYRYPEHGYKGLYYEMDYYGY